MFPGGMEVGDEELAALERVIRSRNLFRYYGVGEGASVRRRFKNATSWWPARPRVEKVG